MKAYECISLVFYYHYRSTLDSLDPTSESQPNLPDVTVPSPLHGEIQSAFTDAEDDIPLSRLALNLEPPTGDSVSNSSSRTQVAVEASEDGYNTYPVSSDSDSDW